MTRPVAGESEDFLGGPPHLFEKVGREQLIVLLEHGLNMESTVADIGCGALRGGRWIIPLLEPGHYCGLEPARDMVQKGLDRFTDPAVVELKKPRFDHNDQFDLSAFGTTFTLHAALHLDSRQQEADRHDARRHAEMG